MQLGQSVKFGIKFSQLTCILLLNEGSKNVPGCRCFRLNSCDMRIGYSGDYSLDVPVGNGALLGFVVDGQEIYPHGFL